MRYHLYLMRSGKDLFLHRLLIVSGQQWHVTLYQFEFTDFTWLKINLGNSFMLKIRIHFSDVKFDVGALLCLILRSVVELCEAYVLDMLVLEPRISNESVHHVILASPIFEIISFLLHFLFYGTYQLHLVALRDSTAHMELKG